MFYVTRDATKNNCYTELTHNHLLKSQINVQQSIVVIKMPPQSISTQ